MAEDVRFATFNASLNRGAEGDLIADLSAPDDLQAKAVAAIVQEVRPEVLLVNEFDFDANGEAAELFRANYLDVAQGGRAPIDYPYVYLAPSNTGIASGFDLDDDGAVTTPRAPGYGNDAFGFGNFPGQFGMALFSQHRILEEEIRTFQTFRWADMPGARLPDDPDTPKPGDFYTPEELAALRLSSKSHWDVPVLIDGEVVHVLAAHPTPPVFDGPEDRNGLRNADEIRFFSDYVTPGKAAYVYDDAGTFGGLGANERFVVMGDMNSDPEDGDSLEGAAQQLLGNPQIDVSVSPTSEGGIDAAARQDGVNLDHLTNPSLDTADFAEPPGNLRVDYVLPSRFGLDIEDAGVFWLEASDPDFALIGDFPFSSSDHRLVWADLAVEGAAGGEDRVGVEGVEFLGAFALPTGLEFDGTEVGGISGLAYDPARGVYYALSDDRSQTNDARFYTLTLNLAGDGFTRGDLALVDVTTLTLDGEPFAPGTIDPEGIAFTGKDTLFIAQEGDVGQLLNPSVDAYALNGGRFESLDVPGYYDPTADGTGGIRNNLAFEALTLTPDGGRLITASENALVQDGPPAGLDVESPSRLLVLDPDTGAPLSDYVYFTDPVAAAPVPADGFATNGLVELLALDNIGSLLALERSFSTGVGNTVRLYEASTRGATDVGGFDALADPDGATFDVDAPVEKDLVIDFADFGVVPDNLEAMAFGPELADGRQSLIVASDNNFSATQETQFWAFALDLTTTPAAKPTLETPDEVRFGGPDLLDPTQERDPDDPAIWVHPDDPALSLVITTNKNTGFRVYDLDGKELQSFTPPDVRYNNVDIIHDFDLGGGHVDLAVFSDRANDTLAVYTIDPETRGLFDVTARNLEDGGFSVFGVDDGERTVYGLGAWTDPATGNAYAFVSQRDGNLVAQLELNDLGNGRIDAEVVRTIELPVPTGDPTDSQAEGIVVDRDSGDLYVALEDEVGILKYDAAPDASNDFTLVAPSGDGPFKPDLEGLTLYYGAGEDEGYLIASGQGDGSYAVFERGGDNAYLGSFIVGANDGVDGAQETDGIDVTALPLNDTFDEGLFVVQDGSNEPPAVFQDPEDGEIQNFNANFKYVGWGEIARLFDPPLAFDAHAPEL